MLEQTRQVRELYNSCSWANGQALGTENEGEEGGWRWLRFPPRLEIPLTNRNAEKGASKPWQ